MAHLALEELLDLADGSQAESEAARLHLASCASCRDRLADARQTLAAISDPVEREVPEPSPLFWEHFSARVHEAVAAESAAASGLREWVDRWLHWRLVVPAAVCLVVLLSVGLNLRAPSSVEPQIADETTIGASADVADADAVSSPETWTVIADLAAELDWDAAVDAGLTPAGGVDRALFDLTVDERRELERLLREELARSGA